MPVISNVTLLWVKCNTERPVRYQNQATAPAQWSVQLRTKSKALKQETEKAYKFKWTLVEADDGSHEYKTNLSTYAYQQTDGKEDPTKLNKPVSIIGGDGRTIDPDTVGNGSIGNVSFTYNEEKGTRRLKAIQVVKWKKYERKDDTAFDLVDDFEIVDEDGNSADLDDLLG